MWLFFQSHCCSHYSEVFSFFFFSISFSVLENIFFFHTVYIDYGFPFSILSNSSQLPLYIHPLSLSPWEMNSYLGNKNKIKLKINTKQTSQNVTKQPTKIKSPQETAQEAYRLIGTHACIFRNSMRTQKWKP